MINNAYTDGVIDGLSLTAQALFNVNSNLAQRTAVKFVKSHGVSSNNILINHGKFGPSTIKMLLKYGIINKQQVDRKLYANN